MHLAETHAYDVRYLAGGTDLLVRLKNAHIQPSAVIDLKMLDAFEKGVVLKSDHVTIGALALLSDIQENEIIASRYPALVEAVASIGSVQIRNRATLGGNICNASPAADSLPSLFIYDARVNLLGEHGKRSMPIDEFIIGPGKTALSKGEILESIQLPLPGKDQAAAFERLTRRRGVDLATINLCCQVLRSGEVRYAVGAAAPVPFVVSDTSGVLTGNASSEEKEDLIRKLMQAASPIDDVRASKEYRQEMLVVLARRTLERAIKTLENQEKEE